MLFLRFLVVGAINTAVGYALFAVFVLAGLDSGLALLLATVLGVLFNFFTTGRLVFDNRKASALPRFVAVYAVSYCFNLALLKGFESMGLHPIAAQAVCLAPVVALTFVLLRKFVFQPRS